MTALNDSGTPLIVAPEDALSIQPFGLEMQVLLSRESTGGAISVIMVSHKPGEGPPDHLHHTQEECIFVVDGNYDVTIGNVTRTVGPGTMLFIPRGCIHRFKNIGTTTGRMLDWSLPGGQDDYFRAISDMAAGAGFSSERAMEISRQYDTNFPSAE
jgi:mannose-6-phosphate isomerase-like protein (cupin superfamily)